MNWWNDVPLAVERPRPQTTVTLEDYLAARSRVTQPRDAVIVELLWCTGMRRYLKPANSSNKSPTI